MRTFTLAFALVVSSCAVARGAIFDNGSFESPIVTPGSHVLSDGALIGPWSVSIPAGCDIALIRDLHEGLAPFDGSQFLNFNGGDSAPGGSVYQDFDTVPGTIYTVSFVAGRLGPAPGSMGLSVSVFGDPLGSPISLATLDAPALGSQGDWTPYSLQFTANSALARLRFTDISSFTTSVDVALDAVQVTAVPAPSVCSLVGVVGVGLLKRRRRVE